MTELRVDAERRTARVGAGVLWGDVVERAGRVDLAALHTSSPGVGVVGSSIGGGLSWYSRRHGLQCSAITAVELVLADGTVARATDDVDSDLLWAARGGGGGFGVVTALEFDLLPVRTVSAGMLVWDWTSAQRVLTTWGQWAAQAPESVTSVARLHAGPRPAVAAGRGQGATARDDRRRRAGRARRGAARCSPRCARCVPRSTRSTRSPAASSRTSSSTPWRRPPVYANSILLDALSGPRRGGRSSATAGRGSGSDLLFVELRQLGGARARARLRAAGPWTGWTAPCSCSAWAWTRVRRTAVREDAGRVTSALAALGDRLGVPPDGRRRRGASAADGRSCRVAAPRRHPGVGRPGRAVRLAASRRAPPLTRRLKPPAQDGGKSGSRHSGPRWCSTTTETTRRTP